MLEQLCSVGQNRTIVRNSYQVNDLGFFLGELTRSSLESYLEGVLDRNWCSYGCCDYGIRGLCQWKRQFGSQLFHSYNSLACIDLFCSLLFSVDFVERISDCVIS